MKYFAILCMLVGATMVLCLMPWQVTLIVTGMCLVVYGAIKLLESL